MKLQSGDINLPAVEQIQIIFSNPKHQLVEMQLRKLILTVAFFAIAMVVVTAQTKVVSIATDKVTVDNSDEDLPQLEGENWTFYHDKDHKVYYIDFETINVNLNELKIKDSNGDVVFHEELWNLPVNTIYELDFSKFKPGNYQVELRTFTGYIKKDVLVETE